jgi:hypothetical protein
MYLPRLENEQPRFVHAAGAVAAYRYQQVGRFILTLYIQTHWHTSSVLWDYDIPIILKAVAWNTDRKS